VDVLAAPPTTELVFYGSEVPAAGGPGRIPRSVPEQHALLSARIHLLLCRMRAVYSLSCCSAAILKVKFS